MKSHSEQMEEQLESRPTQRTYALVQRSEFFTEPSVHETWIRNRVPRGTHYDSADDGPEIEIIAKEAAATDEEVREIANSWLSPKRSWPSDVSMGDVWNHRRE